MNILDYTYDLNIIEEKFAPIGQTSEVRGLRSFLDSNPTKEEIVDKFMSFLVNLPDLYDEESVGDGGESYDEGYDRGVDDGYNAGFKDGYAEGKTDGYEDGFEDAKCECDCSDTI